MDILQQLGIEAHNAGGWAGCDIGLGNKESLLTSTNPATGELIASVYCANNADYDAIISGAQAGFLQWRQVPAPVRGECIRQIAQELRQKKSALGALIAMECGKIKAEGEGEVQEMIDMADLAVGQSRMLYGKVLQSERKRHRMYEQWLPLGPIGVITAFNFPMAVWAWNAFIAAICGDTVVWKPSSKVPLCAIAVQKICNQVMAAQGYENVFSLLITDDNTIAQQLVMDTRLPLISFTGSTQVGREIAKKVAERLGHYILELSGNNAIIVDETADLKLAIPSIFFGAMGTAGQRCTSTRRLIVHHSRYQEVKDQLVAAYQQIKIGNPLDNTTMMGPLIDDQAVIGYQKAIAALNQLGAKILYGGKIVPGPGYFVEPTLVRAYPDWPLVQQETFSPILYIMTYTHLEEAIAMQNNVRQGLSSALFTESLKNAEYFLSVLGSDCGIANINIGTSGAEISGAFGGEKETGGGREAGSDVWKYYMRRQTNTINWSDQLPLAQGLSFAFPHLKGSGNEKPSP